MADKAKITAKENVFSLELSGVQSGDSGQYSCRVTDGNQVTITCSANLEVHGRKFKIYLLLENDTRPCFFSLLNMINAY